MFVNLIAPHLHWHNSRSSPECDKVIGEIILPGDERYDLGEKSVAKGEEGG